MAKNRKHTVDPIRQWRLYAAEIARREGMAPPRYRDGDSAVKRDYDLMLALSRDMYRNNGIYVAAVDALVNAIIGEDGVELAPRWLTRADRQLLMDRWLPWTLEADYQGLRSFTEIERWFVTEWILTGRALVIKKRASMTLQCIDTERIERVNTNPVTGRIESFTVKNPEDMKEPTTDIPAEDAIYFSLPKQASQIGGNGVFWCILDVIEMMMTILRSSAKNWDLTSRIVFTVSKENPNNLTQNLMDKGKAKDGPVTEDEIESRFIELDAGTFFLGKVGEDVKPFQHNAPAVAVEQHILTFLRIVTAVIGCDAATFIWHDFSKVSYVASRAAAQGQRRAIGPWQNKLRYRWYNPVYKWLVGTWTARGELPDPYEKWAKACDWIFPQLTCADEKTENESDALALDRGLATYHDVLRKRNKDPYEIIEARKQEIREAVLAAHELTRELAGMLRGQAIPWQSFAGLSCGKTEAAVIAAANSATVPPPGAPVEPESPDPDAGGVALANPVSRADSGGPGA